MLEQEVNINYFCNDSYVLSASKNYNPRHGRQKSGIYHTEYIFFDSRHRYVLALWVIF